MRQLVQLQKDLKEIEAAGLQLVAVSYDSAETLKKFSDERNITFPLLSDPGSKTIISYAVKNQDVVGQRQEGIPYPGTFIVGRDGVVRAKLFLEGYVKRHTTDQLVQAAKKAK